MSKTNRATGVKVAALLRPETINLNLQARDKVGVLREVASLLSQSQRVANFEVFVDEILERERISSTALAYDVAIPHARWQWVGVWLAWTLACRTASRSGWFS